jgi:hypothetical protein
MGLTVAMNYLSLLGADTPRPAQCTDPRRVLGQALPRYAGLPWYRSSTSTGRATRPTPPGQAGYVSSTAAGSRRGTEASSPICPHAQTAPKARDGTHANGDAHYRASL